MAIYNTASDAANTAVRAFLTEIGEFYLQKSFNTSSGYGKHVWLKIRDVIFEGKCAYCERKDSKLQMEHLIMFNKVDFGLHHPGNIVPVCSSCNTRSKNKNNFHNWKEHLLIICRRDNQEDKYDFRLKKIEDHINEGEYKYPILNKEE